MKMKNNSLKVEINMIELGANETESSILQKFNKIFKIFESSLNHSFEESINIYYSKITTLLSMCSNHNIFFEILARILNLFHEMIFRKPKQDDYCKLITIIYKNLGIKSLLKMVINRVQENNFSNIRISNEGLFNMMKSQIFIFKIIFISIAYVEEMDQEYLILASLNIGKFMLTKTREKQDFNAFSFSFVQQLSTRIQKDKSKKLL